MCRPGLIKFLVLLQDYVISHNENSFVLAFKEKNWNFNYHYSLARRCFVCLLLLRFLFVSFSFCIPFNIPFIGLLTFSESKIAVVITCKQFSRTCQIIRSKRISLDAAFRCCCQRMYLLDGRDNPHNCNDDPLNITK